MQTLEVSSLQPQPENPFYTQVPNIVIDYWLTKLKPTTNIILLVLCRKIFGWHKDSDFISKGQLCKVSGLAKNTVQSALEELESHKLITKCQNRGERGFNPNSYSLNLKIPVEKICRDPNESSEILKKNDKKFDPGVGKNLTQGVDQSLTPQKKDYTKEREKKKTSSSKKTPVLADAASEVDEAAQRLSEMFLGKSKELKADTTRQITSAWLKSFKSLLKKRTEKQLEEVISWMFLDSFWKNVIVAPSGMEKHLEKLELKMQQEQTQKAINPAFNKQRESEIAKKYASLPLECTKKVLGGSEVVLRLDSVFKSLLSHKARYSSEEIYQAWEEFLAYQGPISDTKRLFEGILEHRRKAIWNQPAAASTTKNSKSEEQSSLETSKENSSESDTKDLAFHNVALLLSAMEK